MDKAEKIKAAKKKLKEFQSHKDPKDLVTALDPADQIANQFFTPEETNHQQLMDSFAGSTPQIASYFDSLNGSNFDIPQQQIQAVEYPSKNESVTGLCQQLEQQNLQIAQLKSELEFHRTTASNLQQNTTELNRLRQETQSHLDVVKLLVAEKTNLIDSLQKSDLQVKSKIEETDELQNRLNISRHRVKQLETEIKNASCQPSIDLEVQAKKIDEIVAARIKEFHESNERLAVEKNEMKLLLSQKRIELENLQKNFDHINTEFHLATVKIAQLSDGPTGVENDTGSQPQVNQLTQEIAIKNQQLSDLAAVIDQLNRDKEASDNQYQNYVSHLTREMETMKESSQDLTNENDSLVKREQELLKHVSDLERQIQQQNHKQKIYSDNQKERADSEDLEKLSSQISALTESNETLKAQLAQIEAEKFEVSQHFLLKEEQQRNMELQMEQLQTQTPNLNQLMTDFEDKSVAASRALSQNQGLKEQLEEMQRAFITMTNDKVELTEKLQAEMHLCKEMKLRYDSMEVDLDEMKSKWHYKEDEMIRLSHENTENEKKIFQQNIEIDRLRHYESKEYHGTEGIMEKELGNNKRMIESLTNKINVLESARGDGGAIGVEDHSGHGHSHGGHSHEAHGHSHGDNSGHSHSNEPPKTETKQLLDEISMLKTEKSELVKAINDFQMKKKQTSTDIVTNGVENLRPKQSVTPSMATEEALEKLQARFRRTMLEVADLTEEKQRLEHVVTQLQFETETIGEYITLYQYQRRVLKQKEHERDVQLKNLAADREKMNKKLLQLNALIEKFVLQHTDNVELAKEATSFLDQSKESEPLIIEPGSQSDNILKMKQETAGKILEILSDIKTANSMCYDADIGVENCSCCLGKLETV